MAELSIAIADDNRQTLSLLGEILEKEDGIRAKIKRYPAENHRAQRSA